MTLTVRNTTQDLLLYLSYLTISKFILIVIVSITISILVEKDCLVFVDRIFHLLITCGSLHEDAGECGVYTYTDAVTSDSLNIEWNNDQYVYFLNITVKPEIGLDI